MSTRTGLARGLVAVLAAAGCHEERSAGEAPGPTYTDVAPLLHRACVRCHRSTRPEASYSLQDYRSTLGCLADGRVAVEPANAQAPLVKVLDRKDHADLLSASERSQVLAWISDDVPSQRDVVHEPGILNPRGPGWHGALAAQDRYASLYDENATSMCGRCHAGAPIQPAGSAGNTRGATPCSDCHREPEGVLACGTCHGGKQGPYPPRDRCYFGGSEDDPHDAHVHPRVRSEGFACATCHPTPGQELFAGQHTNGKVEVTFSASSLVGDGALYDPTNQSCAVGCHDHQGSHSQPDWEVRTALDCQSCHRSPPEEHYPGTCDTCHRNMGKTAESLKVDPLHMNGKLDVGDGQGTCGSCHGADPSGAPNDVSHPQHLRSLLTSPIACDSCHAVPTLDDLNSPASHMNGRIEVALSGRAVRPDILPSYHVESKTCSEVACHGQERVLPRWGLPSEASSQCTACHLTPPPPPHSTSPGCGGGLCHQDEVAPLSPGFRITESGRAIHIDGHLSPGAL